ncbi:MAG: hypothetical protein Ct9H300mP32_3260 [Verrucomicrobiota bacterium]|nr:MAG: hypothetical protein Ct9H300mP32_3260 [Verrucomicrobiota bacterium]
MVPMILRVVIFYFLLIRPQQKKAKEHRKWWIRSSPATLWSPEAAWSAPSSVKDTTVSIRSLESKFEVEK